jgi:predicted aminopeptidase
MATGAGFGGLVTALLPLVGVVTILRARAARKRGGPVADEDFEARQAATRESERRMAAYLAQSRSGGYHALDEDDKEIRR